MGFLGVLGDVITYNNYKEHIPRYKKHGLKQFVSNYKAHCNRKIEVENLKWGEEMEYQIYVRVLVDDCERL